MSLVAQYADMLQITNERRSCEVCGVYVGAFPGRHPVCSDKECGELYKEMQALAKSAEDNERALRKAAYRQRIVAAKGGP